MSTARDLVGQVFEDDKARIAALTERVQDLERLALDYQLTLCATITMAGRTVRYMSAEFGEPLTQQEVVNYLEVLSESVEKIKAAEYAGEMNLRKGLFTIDEALAAMHDTQDREEKNDAK